MEAPLRSPAVAFDDVPGSLPEASVPPDADLNAVAQSALEGLNSLRREAWASDAIWRDLLAFTDNFRTFNSQDKVYHAFRKLQAQKKCSPFELATSDPRVSAFGCVDIEVRFTTQHGHLQGSGAGIVSVILVEGQWRIWMLRTWLENFRGHGHPDVDLLRSEPPTIVNGHIEGVSNGTANGSTQDHAYGAIVVGGGQAGLCTAGRLQALGVDYVLLERFPEVGDVWKGRYDKLRFHTSKDFGVLPFKWRYPEEDDNMLPTSRIGAGHSSWAKQFGINVRTNMSVVSGTYDSAGQVWTVVADNDGKEVTYRARNLVLCIGPGLSTFRYPDWATPDKVQQSGFKGDILHGLQYKSAKPWAGKRGIVVGSANTGNDVAEDMADFGLDTTMIQRNPTLVIPAEWIHAEHDRDYHPGKLAAVADRELVTLPNKIVREATNRAIHHMTDLESARFDALEKAGFRVQRRGDLVTHFVERFGGHYMDIGACARIVKGEIKVRSGQPIKGLTPKGLEFAHGSELAADVIVVATGFEHDFRADVARMLGTKSAEQMDDYGRVDAEGEVRGSHRLAGHPGLYYHGHDIRTARFYSSFVALSIQADVLGETLQPYRQ